MRLLRRGLPARGARRRRPRPSHRRRRGLARQPRPPVPEGPLRARLRAAPGAAALAARAEGTVGSSRPAGTRRWTWWRANSRRLRGHVASGCRPRAAQTRRTTCSEVVPRRARHQRRGLLRARVPRALGGRHARLVRHRRRHQLARRHRARRPALAIGANVTEAHPVTGARIRHATLRGVPLVVIDPRVTELAEIADVHLQVRPGGERARC